MSNSIDFKSPELANVHAQVTFPYKEIFSRVVPYDVQYYIYSFLDVPTLTSLSECSRLMYTLSSNCSIWSKKCEDLWKDKVFICEEAKTIFKKCTFILQGCHKNVNRSAYFGRKDDKLFCQCCKEAYKCSFLDSIFRHDIKKEELCSFVWSFRFKESSGKDWISWDPWWDGKEARKFVFHSDGRVSQVETSSFHNENFRKRKNNLEIDATDFENANIQYAFSGRTNDCTKRFPGKTMKWRFIAIPLDLPGRDIGGYIRISIDGRDVPTYIIRRSPTNNWGFIIENCWGLFSSFNMPLQGESQSLEDKNLLIGNSFQWKEALLYNMGVNTIPEEFTFVKLN